eukprot:1874441-Prorocentrum_lima.AAC.1
MEEDKEGEANKKAENTREEARDRSRERRRDPRGPTQPFGGSNKKMRRERKDQPDTGQSWSTGKEKP